VVEATPLPLKRGSIMSDRYGLDRRLESGVEGTALSNPLKRRRCDCYARLAVRSGGPRWATILPPVEPDVLAAHESVAELPDVEHPKRGPRIIAGDPRNLSGTVRKAAWLSRWW
jgi:hypothetical protein